MFFVLIAGGSASGKSRIAKQLLNKLLEQNITTEMISMDDFYKPKSDLGDGNLNFDSLGLSAMDFVIYDSILQQLAIHKVVESPIYSFECNDRLEETKRINATNIQVVIVEGIYALHHIPKFESSKTLSFFIEADSYLTYQKQRIVRDGLERNRNEQEVLLREKRPYGVRNAFFTTILPTKKNADVCITNNPSTDLDKIIEEMSTQIMEQILLLEASSIKKRAF